MDLEFVFEFVFLLISDSLIRPYSILFFAFLLYLLSCKPKPEMVNVPDDFVVFYDKFLSDSAYQMEHIRFPLEGLPSNADSSTVVERSFRWLAEDWEVHKSF